MGRFGLHRPFVRRQDGGVAIVTGLSIVILCLSVGLALDFARAYGVEAELQSDLDKAVLGAASHMATPSEIQSAAQAFFDENWKAKHAVTGVTIAVAKTEDNLLRGTAIATVPTTLMRLGGFNEITLNAISEVEVAGGNVELALVLDTTGSMAGAKLDSLKEAAKTLIDTAYQAPDASEHVKIGIVPFGQYVNVGIGNRNEPWMNVDPDSSMPRQWCRDEQPVTGTSNCRMETFNGVQDGVPYSYQSEVCDHTYGPSAYVCTDYTETNTWNGCAGSRNSPLDTKDEQYSTPVPGVMNAWCGAEVTPLTNDKDVLDGNIDALIAAGDTYMPAGLMWGWALLSKDAPYTEGAGYGEKVDGKPVKKFMVLMTDGFNTLSPTYPAHDGSDTVNSNALTSELCINVKAKGVTIYTVAFEVSDNAIKNILEACASSSSNFFEANDSDELAAAFRNIAKDFAPLRLAR